MQCPWKPAHTHEPVHNPPNLPKPIPIPMPWSSSQVGRAMRWLIELFGFDSEAQTVVSEETTSRKVSRMQGKSSKQSKQER
jgi:hypothetical protein